MRPGTAGGPRILSLGAIWFVVLTSPKRETPGSAWIVPGLMVGVVGEVARQAKGEVRRYCAALGRIRTSDIRFRKPAWAFFVAFHQFSSSSETPVFIGDCRRCAGWHLSPRFASFLIV